MALNRYAIQERLDDVIKALDELIADDRHIDLRITGGGFHLKCFRTRREVTIAPARRDECLVFEFADGSISWMQNVIAILPGNNPDLGAHCVDKWFAVDDGFLFNVPKNGDIPAHSVSRTEGKHARGPVKE